MLLTTAVGQFVRIPLVVFEIVLGLVIGPAALGWVEPGQFTSALADLGLAMLFFLAGQEIDFATINGRPLRRAAAGWVISIAAGVVVGVLAPSAAAGVFVGVALSSTSLGTIMPVLRDARELATPFGRAVTAVGAAGEFGPLWPSRCSSAAGSSAPRRPCCSVSPSPPDWRSGSRHAAPTRTCTG